MKNTGFTLLELLFVVAIAAILLSFALPSFQATVQSNQLASCSNKVVTAIQFAKSEAITSRRTIHVAQNTASTTQPAFRVGEDTNGNNSIEDAELIQDFSCSGEGLTITAGSNFVSFNASGFRADGLGTMVFTTCNAVSNGKVLTLSTGGGLSTTDAASGGCP